MDGSPETIQTWVARIQCIEIDEGKKPGDERLEDECPSRFLISNFYLVCCRVLPHCLMDMALLRMVKDAPCYGLLVKDNCQYSMGKLG